MVKIRNYSLQKDVVCIHCWCVACIIVSMPEWYNPAYPTSGAFGHAPRNPYTGAYVPYTGSPEFKDYVNELQLPQLLELVDLDYDLKIIW